MGSVNLDNTGSGSAVTLSSDGTSLLLDGTAIGGGGGAALYAANEVSVTAQPSATGDDAIAIGDSAVASGANAVASGANSIASGTSSFAAGGGTASGFGSLAIGGISGGGKAVASSDTAIALGYQAQASNAQTVAIGRLSSSSGDSSLALGRNASATGSYSTSIGQAYSSGTDSFAAAIGNNTSSYGAVGANSISMGSQAKASNSDSVAIGDTNIASGVASFASGKQTEASAIYARSGGYLSVANVSGDAWASGNFATAGDAQNVKLVIRGATSNTSPVILTTTGGAASGSRSLVLETNSAYAFSLMVVARRDASDGTESAAVKIEGLIRKESNDASITLVNSNTTTISNAPSWTVSVSATAGNTDEGNGGLDVVCADFVNGHNIRWVGTLKYTKVTYA